MESTHTYTQQIILFPKHKDITPSHSIVDQVSCKLLYLKIVSDYISVFFVPNKDIYFTLYKFVYK